VTHWIGQLKTGDDAAAGRLWQRYFQRLVALAREKLRGVPRAAADEEDVALSAFDSFCRGAKHGRFPLLHDRDDLWGLLIAITAHKAIDLKRHEGRAKRGAGLHAPLPPADPMDSSKDEPAGKEFLSREPSPEFAAQVADEYRRLLESLGDPELESVAIWKMEGYTNDEIAQKLAVAPRTIHRKLRLIRSIWSKGLGLPEE
jgi:DNA-directed RNA polymerase specialized sigma24 family protein